MAVAITRTDLSARNLRVAATNTADAVNADPDFPASAGAVPREVV